MARHPQSTLFLTLAPVLALVLVPVLGGCSQTRSHADLALFDFRPAAPEFAPVVTARGAEMIPYPGLDVAYVDFPDAEVYHSQGLFYCFYDGHWFQARSLAGEWTYVEMKRVPRDLFRARGTVPPSVARRGVVEQGPPVTIQRVPGESDRSAD